MKVSEVRITSKYIKKFSMTVRLYSFPCYPAMADYKIIKSTFPKWFQEDHINEGLGDDLIHEFFEEGETGLFRVSGFWQLSGDEGEYFETKKIKVVRICKKCKN